MVANVSKSRSRALAVVVERSAGERETSLERCAMTKRREGLADVERWYWIHWLCTTRLLPEMSVPYSIAFAASRSGILRHSVPGSIVSMPKASWQDML